MVIPLKIIEVIQQSMMYDVHQTMIQIFMLTELKSDRPVFIPPVYFWVGELLMGLHDLAFLPTQARFSTTFLRNCDGC